MQSLLQRYTFGMLTHLARTAACNQVHSIHRRCACLLLMCRDRVERNAFPLTHDLLATQLGARRASVTESAKTLQRAGIIDYHRGRIRIVDSPRLEANACEDYSLSKTAFDRVFVGPAA